MTRFAGEELPEAVYGGSALELEHAGSGARLRFCARDALRGWALLQAPPLPHRAAAAAPHAWDFTFTTAYATRGPLSASRLEASLGLARRKDLGCLASLV